VRLFSGNRPASTIFFRFSGFFLKIFPPKKFRPEKNGDFQLSRQKFLGRPTFDRNFFGIFKFRTEKNSRKIRSRKITVRSVYDGKLVGCLTDTFFSNFRATFFLKFSTFDRKNFRILKFRAEIFPAQELSIRKILCGKNFSASVPGSIGRAGFCREPYASSVECGKTGVFSAFVAIVRNFLGRTNFRAKKNPGNGENWGTGCNRGY
jgi:hypothetical protein